MRRSRPDSYQPPYAAYQTQFPTDRPDYVMAIIGVQSLEVAARSDVVNEVLALVTADLTAQPDHVERGIETDAFGYGNDIFMMYWSSAQAMQDFWERGDVRAWLERPLSGDVGWWRESMVSPATSVDGNYSLEDIRYGVGRHLEQKLEQFHAYFGSMRDRVDDYLAGMADGASGQVARQSRVDCRGRRLRICDVPDKVCFIRGAFGWDKAKPQEQQAFVEDMLPVFKTGAKYLRDNPLDSNCVTMRFIEEIDMGLNNGVQVEVLGWFLTLKDLEEWTHHRPTHLAIYQGVQEYMARFNFGPRLNMGHEVAVVPQGGALLEYCNCHPDTGFLPFFNSEEV